MQALQKRQQGIAAPLKKLHNRIKRMLLQRFASDADRLLDLACGRGGDLHKWLDCRVKYVRGYDIAEGEVWNVVLTFCWTGPQRDLFKLALSAVEQMSG